MNALPVSVSALALLVDGENIPRSLAGALLAATCRFGTPQVRRVYGAMDHIAGWEAAGFRLCPSPPGKNAADLRLAVDAMALALRGGFATLALASSDRDFTPLAEALREAGHRVIGLGEAKAPRAFRTACSEFVDLTPAAAPPPAPALAVPVRQANQLVPLVRAALKDARAEGGWSTADWIRGRLRKADPQFRLTDYTLRPMDETLLALNQFETARSPKGTLLFRWPVPAGADQPRVP